MATSDTEKPPDLKLDPNSERNQTLREVTDNYTFPRCVKVVGGNDSKSLYRRTGVKSGDFIYLHTIAVETVTLSYKKDAKSAPRLVHKIPADCDLKFRIIPPRNHDIKNPKVFPTVKDLLDVLPTKFQANLRFDDPYLPAIFKPGEVFRFRRKTRCPVDGQDFLECEDESGTILQLPGCCRGDFTVIEDERTYTLQEIVSFGPITRKLILCTDDMKIDKQDGTDDTNDDFNDHTYTNFSSKDILFSKITGMPLNFKGIITLQRPEVFIMASPRDNLEVKWKLDLNLDINVLPTDDIDYEEPLTKEFVLDSFMKEHEAELPVTASITRYKSVPTAFRKHIQRLEVILHRIELQTRLLGKTNNDFYCIPRHTPGRFRVALKRFQCIEDILDFGRDLHVKVLEEIATDVPSYFSLKSGDVLLFTDFNIYTRKIKYSKKNTIEFLVVNCIQRLQDGSELKIDIPADFELSCIQIPPPGAEEGFAVKDVFSGLIKLPISVDYLPIEGASSCIRFDREITLEHLVSDPCVLVTPVPTTKQRRQSGLESKTDACLRVPIRHKVFLKLREKLNFPPNYFRLPPKSRWTSSNVESMKEEEYKKLARFSDQAYEDCEVPAPTLPKVPSKADSIDKQLDR